MPRPFQLLLIFAFATCLAARDVTVRLNSNTQNKKDIRRIALEEYVAAALAGESAGFRSEQALKAMAVVARTYAIRFLGRHKAEGYDFCDTTHCQDVRFSAVTDRLRQAAGATEDELLWFEGSPAAAFYSKDCGGSSEAVAQVWPDIKAPYLIRHDDPYCPRERWSSSLAKADAPMLRILARTPSGRVARLQSGGRIIAGPSLRFSVGRTLGWDRIPSDLYQLTDAGDRYIFEGRGSGHGVGLCQLGADRMGKTYREILAFYYPGTKLGVSAQGFPWVSLGGERIEVWTTQPRQDGPLVALADRLARAAEDRTGLRLSPGTRLKIYPTVAAFRDATGEPGWVAASSRGRVIRMQPAPRESTLRHELTHALVEGVAKPGLPVWFREGIVVYLTAPSTIRSTHPPDDAAFLRGAEEARRAYALAGQYVTELVARSGEPAVLSWISRGLPPDVRSAKPAAATR